MTDVLFFIFSFMMCWGGCVLYPKVKEKVNAVICVMLGYITTLCWGALGALGLKLTHLPIDLVSMAGVYAVIAAVLWGIILYKRTRQKLEVRKCDIVGIVVGAVLVGAIALHIFTPYVQINYNNTIDPGSHFEMAARVMRTKTVDFMYFSSLHNAMFMDIVMHFIPAKWNYKAFILADCFQTLMEFYFFYAFMIFIVRKKGKKYLPIIMTTIYWLGYPLYSWMGGAYVYWAMGVTLVQYVFMVLRIYEERKEMRKTGLLLLGMGCFAVTICYVEFTPAVLLSVFVSIFFSDERKWDRDTLKKYVKWLLLAGVAGALLAGVGYYFLFYARGAKLFGEFRGGRNTSKNLEMVIGAPIIYYIVYKSAKLKKWNTYILSLISFLVVQFTFTMLATLDLVSSYYLFKPNFVFWSLTFIIVADQYDLLVKKEKQYIGHYLLIATLGCMLFYTPSGKLESDKILDLDNSIWRYNAALYKDNDFRDAFAEKSRNLMEYIAENYQDETVAFISTNEQIGARGWYAGITGQENYFVQSPFDEYWFGKYLERTPAEYAVIFYGSEIHRDHAEYFERFERVYESEEGFIFYIDKDRIW